MLKKLESLQVKSAPLSKNNANTKEKQNVNFTAQQECNYDLSNFSADALYHKSMLSKTKQNSPLSFKGWDPEPENVEKIQEIVDIIKDPNIKKIGIIGHQRPDGDCITSTLALQELINLAGKESSAFIIGREPKSGGFIKNTDRLIGLHPKKSGNELVDEHGKFDLFIAVDVAESKLLGNAFDFFKAADKTIRIDHHVRENKQNKNSFADVELVNNKVCSASELIMQFTKPLGINPEDVPQELAQNIYAGMMTDSGFYSYLNNNNASLALKDAGELVSKGFDLKEFDSTNRQKIDMDHYNFKREAEKSMKFNQSGEIAYLVPSDKMEKNMKEQMLDFKTCGGLSTEVIQEALKIDSVKAAFRVIKQRDKHTFVFRTGALDLRKLAESLGGGGHPGACVGHVFGKSTKEAVDLVLEKLKIEIEKQS